jgi:hypothetical protein
MDSSVVYSFIRQSEIIWLLVTGLVWEGRGEEERRGNIMAGEEQKGEGGEKTYHREEVFLGHVCEGSELFSWNAG